MIDNEFDLKIALRILNPENNQVHILMKIRKMLLFSKSFQYPYRFQYQSKIIRVIQRAGPLRKK